MRESKPCAMRLRSNRCANFQFTIATVPSFIYFILMAMPQNMCGEAARSTINRSSCQPFTNNRVSSRWGGGSRGQGSLNETRTSPCPFVMHSPIYNIYNTLCNPPPRIICRKRKREMPDNLSRPRMALRHPELRSSEMILIQPQANTISSRHGLQSTSLSISNQPQQYSLFHIRWPDCQSRRSS